MVAALLCPTVAQAQAPPTSTSAPRSTEKIIELPLPPGATPPEAPPPEPTPEPAFDPENWKGGDPVPPGYRVEPIGNGVKVAGIVMLAPTWFVSAMVGYGMGAKDLGAGHYLLLLPVAGPFATMATVDPNEAGITVLLIDGIVQSAGLITLIAWLAMPSGHLVEDHPWDQGSIDMKVVPLVSPGFAGVGLSGTF